MYLSMMQNSNHMLTKGDCGGSEALYFADVNWRLLRALGLLPRLGDNPSNSEDPPGAPPSPSPISYYLAYLAGDKKI